MKFATLIALFASASAAITNDSVHEQMVSLQTMVQTAKTHKAGDMITAISTRKSELENKLALNQADKQEVARELQYLLSLVQNIEQNNFDGAVKTLTHRKNKLMKYQMHLAAQAKANEQPALMNLEEGAAPKTPEEIEAGLKALKDQLATLETTLAEKKTATETAEAAEKKAKEDLDAATTAGEDTTDL
jgi:hypothetical protein